MAGELNAPVKLEKIPINFPLNGKVIDGATVRPLLFQAFADCIATAHQMNEPKAFDARLRRVRMSRQVAYHTNGSIVSVTPEQTLLLPIPEFYKIVTKLDTDEGKPGKVLRDGDGINQAITYQLGTPLVSPGKDKAPVTELEFLAQTYGDIEEVISADGPAHQAAVLIRLVAKPLGTTLMRLPDSMLAQITISDGVTISNDVLPRFLGPVSE